MEKKTYTSPMMEIQRIESMLTLLGTSGDISTSQEDADKDKGQLVKPMFDSSFGEDNGNEW